MTENFEEKQDIDQINIEKHAFTIGCSLFDIQHSLQHDFVCKSSTIQPSTIYPLIPLHTNVTTPPALSAKVKLRLCSCTLKV